MSGPPGVSGEIPGAGVDADGAVAPCVGRDRGARPATTQGGGGGAGGGGGSSRQSTRPPRAPPPHPDRDAQFRHITAQVRQCQAAGQPVISVDTKKKELVGDFKNAGRTWRPAGQPETVRVHDFLIPAQGKAVPYGVYDLTRNARWRT